MTSLSSVPEDRQDETSFIDPLSAMLEETQAPVRKPVRSHSLPVLSSQSTGSSGDVKSPSSAASDCLPIRPNSSVKPSPAKNPPAWLRDSLKQWHSSADHHDNPPAETQYNYQKEANVGRAADIGPLIEDVKTALGQDVPDRAILEELKRNNNSVEDTIESLLEKSRKAGTRNPKRSASLPAVGVTDFAGASIGVDVSTRTVRSPARSKLLNGVTTLTKYGEKLRATLKIIEQEEVQIRKESADQLDKLQRWAAYDLIPLYRKYAERRIARVEARRNLQKLCVSSMEQLVADINQTLQTKYIRAAPQYDEWIADPAQVMLALNGVSALWDKVKALDSQLQEIGLALSPRLKAVSVPLQPQERTRRLQTILRTTNCRFFEQDVAFFEKDPDKQNRFDQLMADERTAEGKFIQRLIKAVQCSDDVDPLAVIATMGHLVRTSASMHKLGPQETSYLKLYMDRLIFPRMAKECFYNTRGHSQAEEMDARYREQVQWLSKYPQKHLGVEDWCCIKQSEDTGWLPADETDVPYGAACVILREITRMQLPLDMLNCLHRTGLKIYELVRECSGRPGVDIGADTFIPIYLYVAVQADLPCPFHCLHFIQNFTTELEKRTELGYYLACFEGVLQYIVDSTPELLEQHMAASNAHKETINQTIDRNRIARQEREGSVGSNPDSIPQQGALLADMDDNEWHGGEDKSDSPIPPTGSTPTATTRAAVGASAPRTESQIGDSAADPLTSVSSIHSGGDVGISESRPDAQSPDVGAEIAVDETAVSSEMEGLSLVHNSLSGDS
eukprot:Rmarinus@m.23339